MKRILNHDLAKPFALALILIGVGLIAFAVFRYAQTSYNIGQNFAFQRQVQSESEGADIALQNESEARVLMAEDMELRDLVRERNNTFVVGGAGLIVLAVGWLLNDLVNSNQNTKNQPKNQPDSQTKNQPDS